MSVLEVFLILAFVIYLNSFFYVSRCRRSLNVPAVGCEGFLASYWSAFQFIRKANVILQEGYQKVVILNGSIH